MPQTRESLWSLVSSRLDLIESGLTLVTESLDCGDGELGAVEGLARDALGGPVLVLLAAVGDGLLPARALAAGAFLQRVGDAFGAAVPEGNFCPGVAGRVLVVGADSAAALIEEVCALPIEGLHACTLEPFRLAGSERFAIRWISPADAAATSSAATSSDGEQRAAAGPGFVAPPARAEIWDAVRAVCERIDPAVVVHGDRYARRISWNGRPLGDIRTVGGALVASAATGVVRELRDPRDVTKFGDQLLRAFALHADLGLGGGRAASSGARPAPGTRQAQDRRPAGAVADRMAATRHAAGGRHDVAGRALASDAATSSAPAESLRSSLAASRLSPEEYSALGDPAASARSPAEGLVAEERPQPASEPDPSIGRSD